MQALQLLISQSLEPAINLAFEEHLIQQKGDYLLLYRNRDSVIMGKHQNPWKELNIEYCRREGIEILRRLSGGGTVYHDPNNLNFSFIRSKSEDFVNFREHIEPISMALHALGVENRITERNDLFIKDRKISGNAEHIGLSNTRLLHHGTLLYNSQLERLRAALNGQISGITTHAVASVPSQVSTISEFKDFGDMDAFISQLIDALGHKLPIASQEIVNPEELNAVQKLASEKYLQWNWTFGHVPAFSYTSKLDSISVRKGLITGLELRDQTEGLEHEVLNKEYRVEVLQNLLKPEHYQQIEHLILAS